MTTTDTRTNYTAGLRALADLLDNRPNLPLPYTGSSSASPITFYALGAGQNPKDVLAQVARMLHGTATKTVSASGDYYSIAGNFYGLHIDATAYRKGSVRARRHRHPRGDRSRDTLHSRSGRDR